MLKNKNSSMQKKKQAAQPVLTPYEELRSSTIERNAQRFKELGLDQLAQQLMEKLAKAKVQTTVNEDDNDMEMDDQDYQPDNNDDQGSDEDNTNVSHKAANVSNKSAGSTSTSRNIPNKKVRTREYAPRKAKKQPLCPASAMEDFLLMQEEVDPLEAHQLELEVQQLEQNQLQCKRQNSSIATSDNLGEIVTSPNEVAPKKKGRGPTNMFEVHARKLEDRVAIYCNDKGQPIGPEKARKELSRFLGTIAHDYNWTPLKYTNWKAVPNKKEIWEYVNTKYILPPESYDWVMDTLDLSWRGFKCRLKRDHYYKYDTYEKRLNSCPDNVPKDHFKILLKYWASTPAKRTSLRNAKNRQEQDNMHTCGPVPFAMIFDEMYRQDGVVPSKRQKFERTRSRKEGRTYDKPFDDTQKKIQEMRRLEALEVDESGDSCKDPFDEVMGDGGTCHKRLVGLGVSRKKPQTNVVGGSLILPKEVMESIKTAVVADVQKELSAEREEFAKEKEAHAARVAEMERATEEQEMRDELATQNETMTLDAIASALAQLRQKDPSLTPEMIAKVIVSSATNNTA